MNVEPERIRLCYRGADNFVANSSALEGEALNRRVEIELRKWSTQMVTRLSQERSGLSNSLGRGSTANARFAGEGALLRRLNRHR